MKVLGKVLLGVVGLVVLVMGAAAVYFRFFFDPNDFRDQIASLVSDRTGREFAIEGEIELQYFPWIGFEVGRTRLGDDPAFGDEDFVSFDKASARVKLMPLLSKELEIGRLTLDGLSVNVIRNKEGVDNWQSLVDGLSSDAAPAAPATPAGGPQVSTQGLGGVEISAANFRFVDRKAGTSIALSDLNLSTGQVTPGKPVDLKTDFNLESAEPPLTARIEFGGEVLYEDGEFRVADAALSVAGRNQKATDDLPFGNFTLTFSTPEATSDGERHQMSSPKITLAASEGSGPLTSFDADIEGESFSFADNKMVLKAPVIDFKGGGKALKRFNGKLSGATLNVTAADVVVLGAPKLAMTVAAEGIADNVDIAFSADALNTALGAQTLSLDNYRVEALGVTALGSLSGKKIVDAADFSGPIEIKSFSPRALMKVLAIAVDTADANALTSLAAKGRLRATTNSVTIRDLAMTLDDSRITGAAGISDLQRSAQTFDLSIDKINLDRYLAPGAAPAEGESGSAADAIELPAETLRGLNIDGRLKIGALTFSGIESSNVEVGLKAAGGNLRVHPSKASLYGGQYSGDIRVDASGEVPVVSINETVSNLDFGPFARTVMPDAPINGRLTGNVKLTGRGHNTVELRQTLNGSTGFSFADGTVEGIDLLESVQAIVALANKTAPTLAKGAKRTKFEKLAGNATVTDGVLLTDDMSAVMPLLNVGGSGLVDLNTKALDFKVETEIVDVKDVELDPKLKKAVGYKIPVYIGGTYDAPQVVKMTASATAIAGQYVKQVAKKRLVDKLFRRDEEEKETQTAVADGTDPAAGEPVEEEPPKDPEEELKDKVDEKAKDLLKDIFGGG